MNDLQKIIGDYEEFLGGMIPKLQSEGFDLADFVQLDVMCYRTATQASYKEKKIELDSAGMLLSEAMVSGRPIATYRLNKPIYFQDWRIDMIELPAPKAGSEKAEGLEHIQLVIYDDLQTFMKKYSDKDFDTRAIKRGVNPMITHKFDDGAVKFHRLSLATAIYLEEELGLSEIQDRYLDL